LDFTKELHGYEIKTSVDSLSRLPLQIQWYGKVLNKITLVVATKHLKKALELIPSFWGVKEIQEIDDSTFAIINVREATDNPTLDKNYFASLLWADELQEVLRALGQYKQLARKAHWNMANRLATVVPIEDIKKIVIKKYNERNSKLKGSNPWKQQKRLM
jgi:hypothetical protein